MKKTTTFILSGFAALSSLSAQSLYYVGQETEETIPLTWVVGANVIWDSNVTPLIPEGQLGHEDEAWSINPYVQANFTTVDPQTTLNFYARVGANFYLDEMEAAGANETTPNIRVGFDINHSVNERLRFSSRNFLSYEMEPEFSVGFSNDRTVDPYFFYSTDNSVGYRWTERLGSYTGFGFTGYLLADVDFADRKSWNVYHQMRYQWNQRTVLTGEYRYSQWTGDASDSQNHFITGGVEYRLSQNSVFVGSAGVQLRSVDGGEDSSSPFLQASVSSQINSKFSVNGFARYGMEDFDTVQFIGLNAFEYSDQQVFRLGLTGQYQLTPRFTGFGGFDLVHTAYDGGNQIDGPGTDEGRSEDLLNMYIGLRTKINDAVSVDASINYTDSSSDFVNNNYDRLRLSLGASYTF